MNFSFSGKAKIQDLTPFLVSAALALRILCAAATSQGSLFPAYYDSDPARYFERASSIAAAWKTGHPASFVESFGHRNYERFLAFFLFIFGISPWVGKILSALLGAGSVVWIWRMASRLGSSRPWLPAALFAFWPSAIYWGSQNFRDPVILFLFLGFAYGIIAWLQGGGLAGFAGAILLLSLCGLFRPEMWAVGGILIFMASLLHLLHHRSRQALLGISLVLVLLGVSYFLSPALSYWSSGQAGTESRSIPQAIQVMRANIFRGQFHASKSAILEGAPIRNWIDLAGFLPRALWISLFLPLPGLYPLEGSLARQAAAVENGFFAIAFAWAAGSFLKHGRRMDIFFVGFVVMTLAILASVLEPDLGTAMRHKIMLLPFIFLLLNVQTAR